MAITFSGLQRARSRYSIGFEKLIINHASAATNARECVCAATLRLQRDDKILNASKLTPARHPHACRRCGARVARLRARGGETIALVPTMGALHAGHLALVRLAHRRADRVIVSIFVNPAQFAPNEDLSTYPRTFAADLAALAALKVDVVWAPSVETMYPHGFATQIVPEGPASAGLEDAFRPHFFAGVATVVAKLLIQCAARLRVVRREGLSAA